MITTSGTFTSATELMDVLHTFLTTSLGYSVNRAPTNVSTYKFSNYYKSVTAYGKTNDVYLNIGATVDTTSFSALTSYLANGPSYKDHYIWGLCYSISSGYNPSYYVTLQPGQLKENSTNTHILMYQYFTNVGVKEYFISSDGNSIFINVYRGDSTKDKGDNASIYICGVMDPKGAGNYNGGTLISGYGDYGLYGGLCSTIWNSKIL